MGQGGFARVFLARDPQLDRRVALKVPRPETLVDDSARLRFQREAKAAAMLSHPAIVPIYESGSVGPVNFIAFAYCPGKTLAEWISARGPSITTRAAARTVARLADAVEHAHQRGVVHRDLKPANVLIDGAHSDDIADSVRIADFGLAKGHTEQDQTVTLTGSIVGTPAYMSPEQARGDQQITSATDVYSLGVILYELLTGQRPFARATHLATLRAIESDEPPAPRAINPDIPRDVQAICLKCLRKTAADRYASAHELSADLNRWLQGRPVQARPVSQLEKLAAWRRRNPRLAAATVLAILFFIAGLAGTTWQWRQADENLALSEAEFRRAEANLTLAREATPGAAARGTGGSVPGTNLSQSRSHPRRP